MLRPFSMNGVKRRRRSEQNRYRKFTLPALRKPKINLILKAERSRLMQREKQ